MWFFNLLFYLSSIYLNVQIHVHRKLEGIMYMCMYCLKQWLFCYFCISEAFNLMLSSALSHLMTIWSVWILILILSYSKTRPLPYTLGHCSKNRHYYVTDCWGEIFMNYSNNYSSLFQIDMCYYLQLVTLLVDWIFYTAPN